MKKTWDGGPAFPQERTLECGSIEECEGLSIRDYFAAKAMQGMLANPECSLGPLSEIPQASWRMAEEMIKARS